MMVQIAFAAVYLLFWAVIILVSMYLTGTWYPLILLIFLINFTYDLNEKNGDDE